MFPYPRPITVVPFTRSPVLRKQLAKIWSRVESGNATALWELAAMVRRELITQDADIVSSANSSYISYLILVDVACLNQHGLWVL